MKVRIEIDTRTFVRFWLVVIGFGAAIYLMYLAKTALIIIASAIFLALALSVPVNALSKYIPGRSRVGATAVAYVSIIAILTAFLFLVVPPIVEQTLRFAKTAPEIVESLSNEWRGVGSFIEQYQLQPQIDTAVASIQQQSSQWLASLSSGIVGSVGSLFSAMAAITITLVLSFLMLVEGPGWIKRMWGLYEEDERMKIHHGLATKMHKVVTNYVNGQLSVSGIGALASGSVVFLLSMFIESIPSNLALPTIAITFVLSLIPMFGATLAGGLVALLILVSSLPAALIFVVFFVVYQQIENNFISPLIQSKYVQLSPLAVLVAVTIGLYLFGLAGGIISIPIAGCVKVLSEHYLDTTRKKRTESKKPVQKLLKQLHVND